MTLLFCLVHGPMNSFILACLYLCAIIHVTCSDGTADKEEEGTKGRISVNSSVNLIARVTNMPRLLYEILEICF